MSTSLNLAAIDLGAESGRVMLARWDGTHLQLEEAHRFANRPVRVQATLHWDILRLWAEIKHGLSRCAEKAGGPLASIGVDTWGVDFGLLDRQGHLLGNPVHYRDGRTTGMLERAFSRVPREQIFEHTGIQFMPINTLYQLLALAEADSPQLAQAAQLLTIPDLLNYWLTGRAVNEFSNATTTQCYNPRQHQWANELLNTLNIPTHIFGEVVLPGALLGPLHSSVQAELGLGAVPVIAPATHDTGSAVAAVPLLDDDAIYLSSGTWSLMGVEVAHPIINAQTLAYNFTNEGGVGGTFRLLKNIMGLWLVQECQREWAARGQAYSYAELTQLAEAAPAFSSLVMPNAESFLAPGDMPVRIQAFCRATGQTVPQTPGAIIRCALESLALEYRWVAERLDELTGRAHPNLHIIGGGAQNALLNQFTAEATGRTVLAGPIEATAIGNVLVQAVALNLIGSLAEGRAVVRDSFPVQVFVPQSPKSWDEAYQRYLTLRQAST
jgi:rhamnulokinase